MCTLGFTMHQGVYYIITCMSVLTCNTAPVYGVWNYSIIVGTNLEFAS